MKSGEKTVQQAEMDKIPNKGRLGTTPMIAHTKNSNFKIILAIIGVHASAIYEQHNRFTCSS